MPSFTTEIIPSIIFYECGNESISEPHMQEMKDIRDQYDPHGGRAIGSAAKCWIAKWQNMAAKCCTPIKARIFPCGQWNIQGMKAQENIGMIIHRLIIKMVTVRCTTGRMHASYNRNMETHAVENVKRWFEFWKERPGQVNV